MPYIAQNRRRILANTMQPETAGELAYCLTELCRRYQFTQPVGFDRLNKIIGALTCTMQEFYRRTVSRYEDIKITQNGDVF